MINDAWVFSFVLQTCSVLLDSLCVLFTFIVCVCFRSTRDYFWRKWAVRQLHFHTLWNSTGVHPMDSFKAYRGKATWTRCWGKNQESQNPKYGKPSWHVNPFKNTTEQLVSSLSAQRTLPPPPSYQRDSQHWSWMGRKLSKAHNWENVFYSPHWTKDDGALKSHFHRFCLYDLFCLVVCINQLLLCHIMKSQWNIWYQWHSNSLNTTWTLLHVMTSCSVSKWFNSAKRKMSLGYWQLQKSVSCSLHSPHCH